MNKQISFMCEKNSTAEYKSSAADDKPHPGDLVQLAAAMMATGVQTGVLKYKNERFNTFKSTDPVMKQAIQRAMNIMAQMRKSLVSNVPPAATPTVNKCKACPINKQCSFSSGK